MWLILLGLGTGAYGVLVGAGGGFILVPTLLLFTDMETQTVAGTSLALVAINSLSGVIAYHRMGLVDRRSGLLFAAAATPGAVLAPFILGEVGGGVFRVLFGVLLTGLGAQMLFRPSVPRQHTRASSPEPSAMVRSRHIEAKEGEVFDYSFNEPLATSFNFFLGFISSFFGTGGGFLRVPILVAAFSFPVRVAVATSIFALTIYASAGALTHASLGHVDWYPTFVWAGIGMVAGAQIGAALAGRLRGTLILRLLVIVLIAMGVNLVAQGIRG